MTRIESIFGGVLALGVLAVVALVFFGEQDGAPGAKGVMTSAYSSEVKEPRVFTLVAEDYVPPASHCDCYNFAYDMARQGIDAGSITYDSQLSLCFELLGPMGTAAFERGYDDLLAEPRRRKSCPAREFL